ncbi:MAG: zinc-dependent alcohol dehydrogenase family protein [Nitrospiraceae bacterium]
MKTRAAVLYEMGLPPPYSDSTPLSIEALELTAPSDGEVLVQIVAAGLCHSDLSVINGSRPRVMPMVLGHEASGIIREVGSSVPDLKEGDHVVFSYVPVCGRCPPCTTGRASLCEPGGKANTEGSLLTGRRHFHGRNGRELHHHLGVSAFSQFTVAAWESLVKIDPSVPLDKAASFGCAVVTGVGAVMNTAKVASGTAVAVFGLGGVGLSAVMGAKAVGAYPIIGVDMLAAKLDLAKRAGASHTVNAAVQDPVEAVRNLSHGGVTVAFEAVGNEKVLAQAYAATHRGEKTVAIGLPHHSREVSIPAVSLVAEERTLMGSYMGSAVPKRDVPRFIKMYQSGLLPVDLLYSRTIALDQVNEAFDTLFQGSVVRQVVSFE